nr:MAG: hypothetical protein DiTV3a_F2ORF14 [Diabrotica toursvirus 3a]
MATISYPSYVNVEQFCLLLKNYFRSKYPIRMITIDNCIENGNKLFLAAVVLPGQDNIVTVSSIYSDDRLSLYHLAYQLENAINKRVDALPYIVDKRHNSNCCWSNPECEEGPDTCGC